MVKRSRRLGRILAIGGGEDPDETNMRILPRLVELAGGSRARVMVCSAPSVEPEEKVRTYAKIFRRIGVGEVIDAPVSDRREGGDPAMLEKLERATAVFITGGDQLRLTSLLSGTRFSEILQERLFRDGLVLAGTSAGAAALGATMIIGGGEGATVRRADVKLNPGLGFWRDAVIDTHFNQRGRVHRLLTIFAGNPQTLGIGLDENTAVELVPGKRFTVIGSNTVMVFDGRVSHTNAPDRGEEDPLALTDAAIHVLTEGYGFDLDTKRPILPGGEVVEK
jgi:cyanophycinase